MRCPKGCFFPLEAEKFLDIDEQCNLEYKERYFCVECGYESHRNV